MMHNPSMNYIGDYQIKLLRNATLESLMTDSVEHLFVTLRKPHQHQESPFTSTKIRLTSESNRPVHNFSACAKLS